MRATSATRAEKRRPPRNIPPFCGPAPGDATSPCNRERPPASSTAVGDEAIQIGDRVVHLQVPGVFTVVTRRGAFFEVENSRGLRMTIHEVALRRLNGPPPIPTDTQPCRRRV